MKKTYKIYFALFLFSLFVVWGFSHLGRNGKDMSPMERENGIINTEINVEKEDEAADRANEFRASGSDQHHPDTIPAMAEKVFEGNELEMVSVIEENASYTRHFITYKSEGLEISGIMNVPLGEGPFPVLVLNHGYIDPQVYKNGQGLRREQDYLARSGYIVIHSDYRNHAQSDHDPKNDIRPRSGYVEDIMNLLSAIDKSEYDFFDKENIGMLGHSMGGGIAINVMAIAPEKVRAYVLLAPISAEYRKNFERWVETEWPELAEKVLQEYGDFEENPEFWKGVSAINYLQRVKAPVMLHQGSDDADVPVRWSRELAAALQKEAKQVEYFEYPGEGHLFLNNFQKVIDRSAQFFDKHLKND